MKRDNEVKVLVAKSPQGTEVSIPVIPDSEVEAFFGLTDVSVETPGKKELELDMDFLTDPNKYLDECGS